MTARGTRHILAIAAICVTVMQSCDTGHINPEKTANVFILPNGGIVDKGTPITMASATQGATIRFVVGGSDVAAPGAAVSTVYDPANRPVISKACTVKAMAVSEGKTDSDTTTVSFTIKSAAVVVDLPAVAAAFGAADASYCNLCLPWGADPGYHDMTFSSVIDSDGTKALQTELPGYGAGILVLHYKGLSPNGKVRVLIDVNLDFSSAGENDTPYLGMFWTSGLVSAEAGPGGFGRIQALWTGRPDFLGSSTNGWLSLSSLDCTADQSGQVSLAIYLENWRGRSVMDLKAGFKNCSVSDAPAGAVETPVTGRPNGDSPEGAIDQPLNLALSSEAGASIYYTLDGSIPTDSSALYQAPIPIPQGRTRIVAAAVAPGKSRSWLCCRDFYYIPRPADNLLTNGDFSAQGLFWTETSTSPATYTMGVENGVMHYAITSPGPKVWSIQLIYNRATQVQLEKGKTYLLRFKAKTDIAARPLSVIFEELGDSNKDGRSWTSYNGSPTVSLADSWLRYAMVFTMNEPTDPACKFDFQLGAYPGDVWIDDVVFTEYQPGSVPTLGLRFIDSLEPNGAYAMVDTDDPTAWFSVDLPAQGDYELSWTDSKDGAYPGHTDVLVTLVEPDGTTVVPGADSMDSGFTVPFAAHLAAGRYLIRIEEAVSGTGINCRIAMRGLTK